MSNPDSLIWLRGLSGCGKTVLSSTIIEYLRASLPEDASVAGYYFNAREDEKRNVSRLLLSLLLQLWPAEADLPPNLQKLFKKTFSQEFSNDDLLEGLEILIETLGHTYIIIDALDECSVSFRSGEESEVEKLVKFLRWLVDTNPSKLHLLVTSRDGGSANLVDRVLIDIIQKGTADGLCCHIIDLQTNKMKTKIENDIGNFVALEMKRWNAHKGRTWLPLDTERERQIKEAVVGRASGMFRLAACLLDLLWKQGTWAELNSALDNLPSELSEVYDRILNDIKGQGQMERASILLRRLLYSERPLTIKEMAEVTMADPQGSSFDPNSGAEDESYISLTLSSFVTISKDNFVQFAHQTVKAYLLAQTTEEGSSSAECMTRQHPNECALLEYAINNWYGHVVRAWEVSTTNGVSDESQHSLDASAQKELIHRGTSHMHGLAGGLQPNSNLETRKLSLSEWADIIKLRLEKMASIDSMLNRNALNDIACEGYQKFMEAIVKILVEMGLDINQQDSYGRTALHMVSFQGHTNIAELLLDKGADIHVKDSNGRTALHTAASQGHDTMTQLLLERGTDSGVKNKLGWTALDLAIQKVVTDFNPRDTRVNMVYHRRALKRWIYTKDFMATAQIREVEVYNGTVTFTTSYIKQLSLYAGSVNFLKTAQIDEVVVYERTVTFSKSCVGRLTLYEGSANFLTTAQIREVRVYSGNVDFIYEIHKHMMQLFLGERENERSAISERRTVQIRRVVLLGGSFNPASNLEGKVINPSGIVNLICNTTPLHLAAERGHNTIAMLLLEHGADPNAKDGTWSAQIGHHRINKSNIWTALHAAAYYGHETIVQLLIEKNADVLLQDDHGWTALQIAVELGHERIIRLLEKKTVGTHTNVARRIILTVAEKMYNTLFCGWL
ncbi:ankyrin repeat-containing protein, putative [Talaromyces stipitatus ATCC 10500]|uniref:Ankyrin repeat-containing protein, putative n=1 Tax=Talaromyces stipitatus (strain ATCC 10500 / CBS 375.48 / QM 6759 / NRRL 1006) TaxID=441959 RepID=B8LWL5_TALSN|nr:ankyrin repeat-containing protein, putative [Talaromyces stipitatus ATCC 10500]EED24412.1 ankyrin repeat-containing protein, putative [Talaromyces stipitatus ATCC 10500]